MARGNTTEDRSTLEMALVGYEFEKHKIEEKIREIQARLKGKAVPSPASAGDKSAGGRRVLSPAARQRIAAAQKHRWAEHRKRVAEAAKEG